MTTEDDDPPSGRLRRLGWEPYRGRHSLLRTPRLLGMAFQMLWHAAPGAVAVMAASQLLAAAAQAAALLTIRDATGLVIGGAASGFGDLLPVLLVLAGLLCAVAAAQMVQGQLRMLISERVTHSTFERLLNVANEASLAAFDSPDFHERLTRAQNAGGRPLIISQSILGIGGSLTILVATVAVLFAIQPVLVPILLVIAGPLVAVNTRFGTQYHQFSVDLNENERLRQYLRGLMTGRDTAKEVRAFGLEPYLRQRNSDLFDHRITELRRVLRTSIPRSVIGSLAASLAVTGTVGVLLYLVVTGNLDVASATAAAIAVFQLTPVLTGLALHLGQLYESSLFVEDYRAFTSADHPRDIPDDANAVAEPLLEIRMDNLTFHYPQSESDVLRDVSLRIRKGEIVALVGENGSGKTTLAKLLYGLYTPQSGRVTWNGEDITRLDQRRLRSRMAILFQDFGRYLFTVRENIALGDVSAMDDHERAEQAAADAGAAEFIGDLPHTFDTLLAKIFEDGVDLSAGQWQRIALARAIFRDPELVVLDEPTAALDAKVESEIFGHMKMLFRQRTCLIVSHRFSTVRLADRIYVLEKGKIVEEGDHGSLMAAEGLYASLFHMQASTYQTE